MRVTPGYWPIALAAIAVLFAANAYALDEAGAKLVIDKFLRSNQDPTGSADAAEHVVADLNGDGRPDIVLMWNVLGPTSAFPKLTVFIDQGRTYRTITTDLMGLTQRLSVRGPAITVDMLMPGPNDPRCCPTKKAQMHFRWQGNKLVGLR